VAGSATEPEPLVARQRLGLLAGPVEREHQLAMQILVEGPRLRSLILSFLDRRTAGTFQDRVLDPGQDSGVSRVRAAGRAGNLKGGTAAQPICGG